MAHWLSLFRPAGLVDVILVGWLLLCALGLGGWLGLKLRKRLGARLLRAIGWCAGIAAGAAVGVALTWLGALAAIADQALRPAAERSSILPALLWSTPSELVASALGDHGMPQPDEEAILRDGPLAARKSVVKIVAPGCGGVTGSGWVARRGVVVTAGHVVAGQREIAVLSPGRMWTAAVPVELDVEADVAVLRAPGLTGPPLELARRTRADRAAVLLGYPHGGGLATAAATIGVPKTALRVDFYEERVTLSAVARVRAPIWRGVSGGPIVDAKGRVLGMAYAATRWGRYGRAVPVGPIRNALEDMGGRTKTGRCPER